MLKKFGKRKLYAYIDESGQDTKGAIFVVSVLILEEEREMIKEDLEEIERQSGKKNAKWNKARPEFRRKYIEAASQLEKLKGRIFFDIFSDTKKYIELTSFAAAKAILKKSGKDKYKVTVFVDAICGLVRDMNDGQAWAVKEVNKLKKEGLIQEL